MNYIVHDIDRDGWGSAALLIAQLGAENCRQYPTQDKEVLPLLRSIKADPGDEIWVLDIPGPSSWVGFLRRAEVQMTWVDHHSDSWKSTVLPGIRIVLPATKKPTTTMKLLIESKIVQIDGSMDFVKAMCSRGNTSVWATLFDGLASLAPELPVPSEALPRLLTGAIADGEIPVALKSVFETAQKQNGLVQQVLADARWQISDNMAVVYISNAHGIKLVSCKQNPLN